MTIDFLVIRNFRNYADESLQLGPGVSVFVGRNGQGKTNLLEACYYLSVLESPRAEREADLARWGTDSFSLGARISTESHGLEIKVHATVAPAVKRKVTVNGVPVRKSELPAIFPCVYFSPDDLYMVKKSSVLRRRFLDSVLSRIDTVYAEKLVTYRNALERRNAALKMIRARRMSEKALEPLNEILVAAGSSVFVKRARFMESFGKLVGETYAFLSGDPCRVEYRSCIGDVLDDEGAVAARFLRVLETAYNDDLARGTTLYGPHRDDFLVFFGQRSARFFGSQGEQRSAALALRMGEARSLEERSGKKPVLLLDDVFSELDEERRKRVVSLCDWGHQILITSTHPLEEADRHFTVFAVESGRIRPAQAREGHSL